MTVAGKSQSNTGTENHYYNLVSVLYHTLEASSTYQQYIDDAQQAGDNELAEFFRNLHEETRRCSEQAKQLLRDRM